MSLGVGRVLVNTQTNNHRALALYDKLPDLKRGDFKVELDNNVLTISSEREDHSEQKDEHGNYTRKEFSYQSFQRSFALPENKVLGEKITARYLDGILHVSVPKSEDAKVKPAKQIAVA